MEKKCVVCGKMFIAKSDRAKYCSKKCANHSRFDITLDQIREKRIADTRTVIDLYDSDFSAREIAEKLGRCDTFVYEAWRDAGLPKRLTSLQKQVWELREKGLCSVEIAELLDKDPEHINECAKRIGKPFSYDEMQKSIDIGKRKAKISQFGTEEERKKKINEFFAENHPDLERVDGWLSGDGMMKVKCKTCGFVFEKSATTLRRKNRKICCPECEEEKRFWKNVQAISERAQRRKQKEIEKENRFWMQDFQQAEFNVCSKCGGIFYGRRSKFCSQDCLKRSCYSKKRDKRIKKIRERVVNKNIELNALFMRDNGVCWLCGGKCDYSDYQTNENGHFIVGKNYPSIDHVIPLAKGGFHSWDNVKLAHHYCNTLKRDKVVSL